LNNFIINDTFPYWQTFMQLTQSTHSKEC